MLAPSLSKLRPKPPCTDPTHKRAKKGCYTCAQERNKVRYARLKAEAGIRMRKPKCTDPTHRRRPGKACTDCASERQRRRIAEKRAARGEVLLIVSGETSAHRAGALAMWARRYEVYGPRGCKPDMVPKRRINPAPRKTHCRRGHLLSGPNVVVERYAHTTRRRCLLCRRLLKAGTDRPVWATVDGVRVSIAAHDTWCQQEGRRLWRAMTQAHPNADAGSTAKFLKARRTWNRFLAEQKKWYTAAAVPMPTINKRGDS